MEKEKDETALTLGFQAVNLSQLKISPQEISASGFPAILIGIMFVIMLVAGIIRGKRK